MSNSLQALFRSRKFLIALTDVIISTVVYLLALFLKPDQLDQIKILIGVWQPILGMVIYAIAKEDAALKSAGGQYIPPQPEQVIQPTPPLPIGH